MIERKGYFISVDSRPMSTTRGTMKKLVDIYKAYLRDCLTANASQKSLKSPFIRLNIRCSPGSYDPNVAAAKDEVLFANEPKLLHLFEEMCKKLYHRPENQAHDVDRNGHLDRPHRGDSRVDHVEIEDGEESMGDDMVARKRKLEDQTDDRIKSCEPGTPDDDNEHIVGFSPDRTCLPWESSLTAIESQSAPATPQSTLDEGGKEHDSDDESSQRNRRTNSIESPLPQADATAPARYLLRATWEVDMTRSKTASPVGESETILLHPVPENMAEFLSRQRTEQTERNQPNPWSIAKKASGRRASGSGEGLSNSVNMEEHDNHNIAPPTEPAHAPGAEDSTQQESIGLICERPEGHRSLRTLSSQVLQEDASHSDSRGKPHDMETQAFGRPLGPNDGFQDARLQEGLGVSRDENQNRRFTVQHDVDDLPVEGVVRSSGFRKIQAQRRPFDQSGIDSVFGTPPPSSPLDKPFRVPARAGPGQARRGRFTRTSREDNVRRRNARQDGLTQSKLILDVRKSLEPPLMPHGGKRARHPSTYTEFNEADGEFTMMEQAPHRPRKVSPSPTERQMDVALERLNTLRPRATEALPEEHDLDLEGFQEPFEKRGRSMDRKLTPALNVPPGRSERRRLASRSRSRPGSKTHKRTISEMLPLERPSSQTKQSQLLRIDLNDIESQAKSISFCDIYITQGLQESGFALEPAEADDVSIQLEEVVGNWAFTKYDVELDLRINIAELLENGDMDIIC